MTLAQTISIRRNLDLNAVLLWRLGETQSYVESEAWKNDAEREQNHHQFLAELTKSINQTQSAAASAITKTIAAARKF